MSTDPRIHSPAPPHRIFFAGRGGAGQEAAGPVPGGGHARGGGDRHQQHVRGAGVFGIRGQGGHAADHRLSGDPGLCRRPSPGKRPRDPPRIVLLAQTEAGYHEPDEAELLRSTSKGDGQLPQVTLDELAPHDAGLICLTGGPDGPVGRLLRQGQRPTAEALIDALHGAVRRPALRRTAAPPRRRRPARGRAR